MHMSSFHKTKRDQIILGDSLAYMANLKAEPIETYRRADWLRRRRNKGLAGAL